MLSCIEEKRLALGMTRQEVSILTGISINALALMEKKEHLSSIRGERAYTLAKALQCEVGEICKICKNCGKPRGLNQLFCSRACEQEYKRSERSRRHEEEEKWIAHYKIYGFRRSSPQPLEEQNEEKNQ